MARSTKKMSTTVAAEQTTAAGISPFKLRDPEEVAKAMEPFAHVMKKGIVCDTEQRGYETPHGRSMAEIVLDASQGFVPLWAQGTILRWRFQESSLQHFDDPEAAKAAIEQLLAEAILSWGNAAPIKFTKASDAWDFEIVVSEVDKCNPAGCTVARAFFPDQGRHDLLIFPRMFTQEREEQVETLAHEIGHIFGLRHFFAQISEGQWPSQIFGTHKKFTIMNYGVDSKMSPEDRIDLKALYQAVWRGELTQINGTPIKLVKPFHTTSGVENVVAVGQVQAAL
jgi:hypothetical protein